jgi:hypothetical protein
LDEGEESVSQGRKRGRKKRKERNSRFRGPTTIQHSSHARYCVKCLYAPFNFNFTTAVKQASHLFLYCELEN